MVVVSAKKQNAVETISHNEYKDLLLNRKYLGHSMSRIQSKDHRIGTYGINKISLSCFDDKTKTFVNIQLQNYLF